MISLKLNKSDYQLIWTFTVFMLGWLSLKFWMERHPFRQIVFDIPIILAKTLTGFFIVRWLVQKYIVEKKQYFLFLVLSTVSLIATGFIDLLRDYFGRGLGWGDLPYAGYIVVHSFYYSAADLALPFVIIVAKKYFENQIQLTKSKEQQKEVELKLLRSQLSPHFLFNNLNTVDALIESNPQKARKYIAKLSSLYRYLISTKDEELIALDRELKMVKNYFYLIDSRFGNAYILNIKNKTEENKSLVENKYLPTGALQTVIENVVKHNAIIDKIPIITEIIIEKNNISIKNNKGKQENDNTSLGTGLQNLKERFKILLGKDIIIEQNRDMFRVVLPLVELNKS